MTTALILKEEVKLVLGLQEFNTDQDDRIETLILPVTAMIEEHIGYALARAATVDYFPSLRGYVSGTDLYGTSDLATSYTFVQQYLRLSRGNVDVGEAIDVRYDPLRVWGADTVLTSDNYYLDERTNTLVVSYATASSPRAFKCSYTAGYAITAENGDVPANIAAEAPADLRMAAVVQTIFMLERLATGSIGQASTEDRDANQLLTSAGFLCPEVKQMLIPYRRAKVGQG